MRAPRQFNDTNIQLHVIEATKNYSPYIMNYKD